MAMKSKDRPTAIFSLNHRTSVYLLQALAEQTIKVPEQVALLGFDELDSASVMSPPLTTVAQSPIELATRSMSLLMERIRGTREGKEVLRAKIVLPVKLVTRASCGCHPKKVLPASKIR
jgi:DNA-binding LacI/PurR family transcriptional regulator